MSDEEYMQLAFEEAAAAERAGEVPIGAVLAASDGRVLSQSGNRTIRDCDPTAHAEVVVLRQAAKLVGNYRLNGVTLYVTLEPCAMCAGAMLHARVARLVYGADDPRGGAVRSCFMVFDHPSLNHRVEVMAGVLAERCAALMKTFFAVRR